jgi:RsiG-like
MDDIVDLVSRSDDELRALIAELETEEREISRRRRVLHGKIDILRAELVMRLQRKHNEGEAVITAEDVAGLSRILAGEGPTPSPPADAAGPAAEEATEG